MHPATGQTLKIKVGAIKDATPEAYPHVIPEVENALQCHHSGESHITQV